MSRPNVIADGAVRPMNDEEYAQWQIDVANAVIVQDTMIGHGMYDASIRRQAVALQVAGKPIDAFLLLQSKGLL